jgi:hypothetical protein
MVRPSPTPAEMPGRLVIFGAAQGMGRWLAEQVFAAAPCSWCSSTCPITSLSIPAIAPWRQPAAAAEGRLRGGRPVFTDARRRNAAPSPLDPPGSGRLALCLAVPADAVDTIASVVLPLLAAGQHRL